MLKLQPEGETLKVPSHMAQQIVAASWIPVVFILIIVAFAWFAVPVSPSVSVFVRISHQTQYPYGPTLEAFSNSYQRVPLSSTPISSKNVVSLSSLTTAVVGNYQLTITVSYANQVINSQTFTAIGEGTYQARITLWTTWQENPSTPYVFSFSLVLGGVTVPLDVSVYPT